MSQHNTLTRALQEIADWNSHTTEFAVDYGSNGVRDFYRGIARAALSATQPAQAAQGEPTLRDYAADLVDAGHDFWKACEREAGGGAVRWLSCDDGTLIVFTRVEYRDEIMAHVRVYKAPVVVFDEDGMTALEAEAAQGEPLCDDEGCDHHGTPHVCVNNKQPAQGAGEVVRDYYQELLTARGAVQELEQKVFSQEQAIAILRTCVASHQRDMADPPAYLQDAVIKAAGLGAMAEQIAELKRQATHTPTQPAAGADVLDAERYRMVRRGQHWSVINGIGDTLRGDDLDAAIDAVPSTNPQRQDGGD